MNYKAEVEVELDKPAVTPEKPRATSQKYKYFRTGVALLPARKAALDARLAQLGLKSLGDLTTFIATADGVTETLLPVVRAYHEKRGSSNRGHSKTTLRNQVSKALKGMTPKEIERLLELAQQH